MRIYPLTLTLLSVAVSAMASPDVTSIHKQFAQKDATIAQLQARITSDESLIADQQKQIVELHRQMAGISGPNSNTAFTSPDEAAEIDQLNKQVAQQNATIIALSAQIQQANALNSAAVEAFAHDTTPPYHPVYHSNQSSQVEDMTIGDPGIGGIAPIGAASAYYGGGSDSTGGFALSQQPMVTYGGIPYGWGPVYTQTSKGGR